MPKMKTLLVLAITIVSVFTNSLLFACTAFMSLEKDRVLVDNNEN
jgi:hypothetical protein